VEEAIRVGTINGAYASYEENLKGSIETGKLADLVLLGRDPLKENPSTLVTIPVERTMAGGRWRLSHKFPPNHFTVPSKRAASP